MKLRFKFFYESFKQISLNKILCDVQEFIKHAKVNSGNQSNSFLLMRGLILSSPNILNEQFNNEF